MPTPAEILKKFNDAKTLPHVAIRLTQMVSDPDSSIDEFEEVIRLDPVLVTRLLKLVNSPFFGLSNKVESISKAVVLVGMGNLRSLVAMEAIKDVANPIDDQEGFSKKALWMHSTAIAIMSQLIAKHIFGLKPEDFFLAGIIHDIGLIIEEQVLGSELRQVCEKVLKEKAPLTKTEDEILGVNHTQVGAHLVKEWKLPSLVVEAVQGHHDTEKEHPPGSGASIIQIAEFMTGKLKYTILPGHIEPLPGHLVKHVQSKMADYKAIVKALPGEMAKAKDLYEVG